MKIEMDCILLQKGDMCSCIERNLLSSIMPIGKLSKFHLFFIKLCVENKLRHVLLLYYDMYQLALTKENVLLLQEKIVDVNH